MSGGGTDWAAVVAGLGAWHGGGDRAAGERALVAVEQWLRTRIAPRLGRRAKAEDLESLFQDVLTRLWTEDLLAGVDAPAAYLGTVVRRMWIDQVRKRDRRTDTVPLDPEAPRADPSPADPDSGIELEQVAAKLETLRVEDRVHVKICDLPHALSREELDWMARRCGRSANAVRDVVLDPEADAYALSFLVDPGPEPTTKKGRRDRLERFRRRRSRARARLRAAVEAG